jgi:hypothetical protein
VRGELIPRSRIRPGKITGPWLVKKSLLFYGTWKFITTFSRIRHLSISWTTSIQSMSPSHLSKIHVNIILPFMPGSFKCFFLLSGFPNQTLYTSARLMCMDISSVAYTRLHHYASLSMWKTLLYYFYDYICFYFIYLIFLFSYLYFFCVVFAFLSWLFFK